MAQAREIAGEEGGVEVDSRPRIRH